jgi:hypothetical protein
MRASPRRELLAVLDLQHLTQAPDTVAHGALAQLQPHADLDI